MEIQSEHEVEKRGADSGAAPGSATQREYPKLTLAEVEWLMDRKCSNCGREMSGYYCLHCTV